MRNESRKAARRRTTSKAKKHHVTGTGYSPCPEENESTELSPSKTMTVSPGARHEMIASLAYGFASETNFCARDAVADWLRAERVIDARLGTATLVAA